MEIYDINKGWGENLEHGPAKAETGMWDFLGHKVQSRLGVAAGPLLSAEWVRFAASMGFGVLTYKTIRSKAFSGHPIPNIAYLSFDGMTGNMKMTKGTTKTITNSFGMPSKHREFLIEDIAAARTCLGPYQVLVVSVTGDTLEEFIEAARIAVDGGAMAVEANFSCPNVGCIGSVGELYKDKDKVMEYCASLCAVLRDIPLIAKVGVYDTMENMKECVLAARDGGARAISGINSVKMEIDGFPRGSSGVCGTHIKEYGLAFVRDCKKTIEECGINDMLIIGVGGICCGADAHEFLCNGADFIQIATQFYLKPNAFLL